MFLIVLHHMTNSLWKDLQFISCDEFIIDLTRATTNIQQFLLSVLSYSGMLGNTIFLICSAWFLLGKRKTNMKKFLHIFADIWTISILVLIVVFVLRKGNIDFVLLLKELLPNLFVNNWYATCYLLLLLVYPILNSLIYSMSQIKLLRISLVLTIIYIFLNYLYPSFFSSQIIIWIAIYFLVAYVKLYAPSLCKNKQLNIIMLISGCAANFMLVMITNILGLKYSLFSDKLLHWNSNCSPLLILMAFSVFNLFRNFQFKSNVIWSISKLTLPVYLFHENLLVRTYYRPYLWKFVYDTFGYRYVLFWLFILSAQVFVMSVAVSYIYSKTGQCIVQNICDKLWPKISRIYFKMEELLLKIY